MLPLLIALSLVSADKPALDFDVFITSEFVPITAPVITATSANQPKRRIEAIKRLEKLVEGKEVAIRIKVSDVRAASQKGVYEISGKVLTNFQGDGLPTLVSLLGDWPIPLDEALVDKIERNSVVVVR